MLVTTRTGYRNGATPFAMIDRMVDDFARTMPVGAPPVAHDLIQTGPDAYRLELPVPGFGEGDLTIEAENRTLTVKAQPSETAEDVTVLRRGFARDGFEHRFSLGEHVQVAGANLRNGVLAIELVRELPEAMKPRTIAVTRAD